MPVWILPLHQITDGRVARPPDTVAPKACSSLYSSSNSAAGACCRLAAFSFPVQFYDTIIEFAYAADAILKEDPTRAPSSIRGAALYEALTKTRTVGMQGRVVIDEYGLKEGHFVIRNVWGTSLPHALRPLPIRGFCRRGPESIEGR